MAEKRRRLVRLKAVLLSFGLASIVAGWNKQSVYHLVFLNQFLRETLQIDIY